ncbi:hypothetical protein [Streptomyces sp. NPDC001480]|uniref:hypothetical protein n=1 Tax=Streptomyces sp. NPDC001480 TaxID=3364577 RepID=UPI0036B4CC5B
MSSTPVHRRRPTLLRNGTSHPATRIAVLAVTAHADHDPDSAQALARLIQGRHTALNGLLEPSGVQFDDYEFTLLTTLERNSALPRPA